MRFGHVMLVIWGGAITLAIGAGMFRHAQPLTAPTLQQMEPSEQVEEAGWRAVHVMVEGCPCSATVAQHLVNRKPVSGWREFVYSLEGNVEPAWVAELRGAGYRVERMDAATLKSKTGASGGPWLLAATPEGKIVYSGGYAERRPSSGTMAQLIDGQILRDLSQGKNVAALPAYGCSVPPEGISVTLQ